MKAFFSNKAAASFFGNSNYTVVYHASNIEIIFKLYNEKGKLSVIPISFCRFAVRIVFLYMQIGTVSFAIWIR